MGDGKSLKDLDDELRKAEAQALAEAQQAGKPAKPAAKQARAAKRAKAAAQAKGGNGPTPPAQKARGTPGTVDTGRFDAVRHILRTLSSLPGGGWTSPAVSADEADAGIGGYLRNGWEVIYVRGLGYTNAGVNVLWVLGHARGAEPARFSEAHHITRTITPTGSEFGSVSGFQADGYLSSYLEDGWRLVAVDSLGLTTDGIAMIWVLCR